MANINLKEEIRKKTGSKIKQDKQKASSPNITINIITINTNILNLPVKGQKFSY